MVHTPVLSGKNAPSTAVTDFMEPPLKGCLAEVFLFICYKGFLLAKCNLYFLNLFLGPKTHEICQI